MAVPDSRLRPVMALDASDIEEAIRDYVMERHPEFSRIDRDRLIVTLFVEGATVVFEES